MASLIVYLWKRRARAPLGSWSFLKHWIKRSLRFGDLVAIVLSTYRLKLRGCHIAEGCALYWFSFGGRGDAFHVGEGSYISSSAKIVANENVRIGSRVVINDDVKILSSTHDLRDPCWSTVSRSINIEDYVWIAEGACILPGVTIGYGAVVGAGAVVRGDVPAFALAIGNPAVIYPDRRCGDLSYEPALLCAAFEAWVGRVVRLGAASLH